jgi:hypothetical protein
MPRRTLEDHLQTITLLALRRLLPNAANNALLLPMLPCRARFLASASKQSRPCKGRLYRRPVNRRVVGLNPFGEPSYCFVSRSKDASPGASAVVLMPVRIPRLRRASVATLSRSASHPLGPAAARKSDGRMDITQQCGKSGCGDRTVLASKSPNPQRQSFNQSLILKLVIQLPHVAESPRSCTRECGVQPTLEGPLGV